jgi:hypothetical protein
MGSEEGPGSGRQGVGLMDTVLWGTLCAQAARLAKAEEKQVQYIVIRPNFPGPGHPMYYSENR